MIRKSLLHCLGIAICISQLVYGMEVEKDLRGLAHQLISAARDNKIEQAKKLLEEPDIDINFTDCYGHNALNNACHKGNFEIVELLVNKGTKINLTDRAGWTPLINACNDNHVAIAKLLIEKGADVNLPDDWKRTPLILTKHPEATLFLLSNGAQINLTADNQWTALHFAACNNELDKAKVLLSSGADINLKDNEGKTARDLAQEKDHLTIMWAINAEIKKRANQHVT